MSETIYAVLNAGKTQIVNLVVCSNAAFATSQGWVGPVVPSATIQVGSTTPDNGVTFVAPVVPVTQANAQTIESNILAQIAQIETWIANNPSGAVLTAGQTLILAQMLAGIGRILLGLTSTVGGS